MSAKEAEKREKIILRQVEVIPVADHFDSLRTQLAHIYFQSWHPAGLCPTLHDAQSKIDSFDPNQTFAVVDPKLKAYSHIHTLLTDAHDIPSLTRLFPTYHSVEAASTARQLVKNPLFRICFSVTSLPGYRVLTPDMDKNVSLTRFLFNRLPAEPTKLAYTRWPAVPMHRHLGATVAAVLDNSRPEDKLSNGQNILMVY